MAQTNLQKIGRLMVKNGTYKDETGKEKNRYHEIGIVLATPHHSRICIKLHANGFGEGMFANVFYDDNKKPNFTDKNAPSAGSQEEISLDEIPF